MRERSYRSWTSPWWCDRVGPGNQGVALLAAHHLVEVGPHLLVLLLPRLDLYQLVVQLLLTLRLVRL